MTSKTQRQRRRALRRELQRGPWLLCGILLTISMILLALALYGALGPAVW